MADPPVSVSEVDGKRLAIVLLDSETDEQTLLVGFAHRAGETLVVDRGSSERGFAIPVTALPRLRRVDQSNQELSELLERAEFLLYLSVDPMPEGADPADYEQTGVNLNEGRTSGDN